MLQLAFHYDNPSYVSSLPRPHREGQSYHQDIRTKLPSTVRLTSPTFS